MLSSQRTILLTISVILTLVTGCPPQPNGNCYYGSYELSSSSGGFRNQACGNTAVNRDWCAVSYMPSTQQANFGCASNFPLQLGGPMCGDGPGFVNQQGCSMVNTENGPCYFCCCKGGSCNHPQIFAREASKLPINQISASGGYGNPSYGSSSSSNYYQIPWYNTASTPSNPFILIAIIVIIFVFVSLSNN